MVVTESPDVIVVGGGLAGLCAAAKAAELGRKVVVLEAADHVGGTGLYSGGSIQIWGAKTYEEYREHCPTADPVMAATLVENYKRFVGWLEETGAPGAQMTSTLRGWTSAKYQIGRDISPQRRIKWFEFMADRVRRAGSAVILSARARHLLLDNGRVSGVEYEHQGAYQKLRARSVVLAAGGFQSSPELLAKYVAPNGTDFIGRADRHVVGDGLALAAEAGAATTSAMNSVYGHLLPAPPCRISWDNYVDLTLLSAFYDSYGVLVNVNGERFVDEGASEYNGLTINAAVQQPPGGLWVVLDDRIRRNQALYELPGDVLRPGNLRHAALLRYFRVRRQGRKISVFVDSLQAARDRGAVVLSAPTVEELAEQLGARGVNGMTLRQTIKSFNESIRDTRTAGLTPDKTKFAWPIRTAPFWAVKVTPGISMTYGGVAIDPQTHVLNDAGGVVAGLYAVPGTAGGIQELYYGGALASCGVFGMIAGEQVAAG